MVRKTSSIFAAAIFACGVFAANAAGFDGMSLATNDWFDAGFTALTAETSISQGGTLGITRGAGSWTAVPAAGTAKIVADAGAGGEAALLAIDAPDEELTFTPAALASATGMETLSFDVFTSSVDELPTPSGGAQGAFAIYSADGTAYSIAAYVSDGTSPVWTNLVYASAADLTNVWFTVTMDFATVSNVRYVRYSITPPSGSLTVLADSEGTEWFISANSAATTVASVSFTGTGDIRTFSGDSLAEVVATVNGVGYGSVADAIAAADDGGTVTLAKAIEGEEVAVAKNVSLALGAYSLTAASLSVASGKTLTISGTGTVSAPAITGGGALAFVDPTTLSLTGGDTSSIASLAAESAMTIWANGAVDVAEIIANADITFAAKLVSTTTLTKKGDATLSFVGVTAPAAGVVVEAGDVVVDNTLSGISPYVILDASDDSTITETDGKVTAWASTVNGHSFTNDSSLMTYVAEDGVFGGKKAVRTNNSQLQSDFNNASASVSVFGALHYYATSGQGGVLFYRSGANNCYIGKRGSSDSFWQALRTSSTEISLWQNGIRGTYNNKVAKFTSNGSEYVLSVEGLSNGSATRNHVGGTVGDIAIAELITLSSNPSMPDRKRIEAHLGTKWGISGMTTLPASVPLTLAGGTSLDLNGLSRTFDSVAVTGSGTATIDGGALVITAPISVAADSTLVIPYGSTYTCASGTGANADATAGTVTLMHKAADIDGVVYDTVAGAITAYESGTLTIYEDATDVDLGTTEVSISGIVLADGVSAPTFATTLPWQTTYSEGTLTHTRVASTFVYVGPGVYAPVASNFEIGGAAASDVPGTADTVQFDTDTTISTASASVRHAAIVVNACVTVNGASSSQNTLNADAISGTGKLSLGDYARLATQSTAATFSCEVAVEASSASTAAQLHVADSGREITLTGALSGAGYLKCTRKSNAANYSGCTFNCSDTTGFTGTIEMVKPESVGRNTITFWPTCDLSGATVIVGEYSSGHGRFVDGQSNNAVYKFGSLSGYVSPGAANVSNTHPTIEIGALGKDDSITGNWMPHSSRNPYIRKVGTGTLTTTAESAYGYILNGGTLKVLATDTAPVTTEVGGKKVVSATETLGEVEYTVYTLAPRPTIFMVR